jgi:hypothetical protein
MVSGFYDGALLDRASGEARGLVSHLTPSIFSSFHKAKLDGISLPHQLDAMYDIFDIIKFDEEIPEEYQKAFTKKFPKVNKDLFKEFTESAKESFGAKVLSYADPDIKKPLFGMIRQKDFLITDRFNLIALHFPMPMVGDPMIEVGYTPRLLGIDPLNFFSEFKQYDLRILEDIYEDCWTLDFCIHLNNQYLRETFGTAHDTLEMANAQKYDFYRGKMLADKDFKRFVPNFDAFFVDKFVL